MAAASWPRVPKGDRFTMLSGAMDEYYETCEDVVELADRYPYAIPTEFLPMVHNLVSGFQNGESPVLGIPFCFFLFFALRLTSSLPRLLQCSRQHRADVLQENIVFSRGPRLKADHPLIIGCDKPGPRAANSTSDPFANLSCQDTPPAPAGTFDPAQVAKEQLTTGQAWSHLFCTWMDPLADFESVTSGDDMTVAKCGAACCGHAYMMLGNGTACYCADGLERLSDSEESRGECNVRCTGNNGKKCGGEESLDVWAVDQVASEYCEGGRG